MKMSLFFIAIVAVLATLLVGVGSAQTQLSIGQVNLPVSTVTCPVVGGNSFPTGTVCYSSTITCSSVADIGFTYGILNASGTKGTIVFFNGSDGTGINNNFNNDALYYNSQGFQTVEVIWQSTGGGPSAWEQAGSGTAPTSIKTAACRPATLLHWIRCGNSSSNDCSSSSQNVYTGGGMCAEGASAGSAAVAYSMAEYGAYDYIDNVEFISGPPLSDIEKGCDPSTQTPTVCTGSGNDSFCNNGGEGGWMAPLNYQPPANGAIDFWTGLVTNRNAPQYCTKNTTYDTQFKQMSIVDALGDSTFSYPDTAMTGWLCAYSATNSKCGGSNPTGNNTPPEGELFYLKVSANPLNVYRVDSCSNAEGVEGSASTVPAAACISGQTAVQNDMVNDCVAQTHSVRSHRVLQASFQ